MCGIAALQLRNPRLHPQMGSLLSSMMCQIVDRGPDSAGLAVYDTPGLVSEGTSTLSLLVKAVSETLPGSTIIGRGEHVAVMKGVGHPMDIAAEHGLEAMAGSQGLSHTRMATESAVTAGGSHPFSVAD